MSSTEELSEARSGAADMVAPGPGSRRKYLDARFAPLRRRPDARVALAAIGILAVVAATKVMGVGGAFPAAIRLSIGPRVEQATNWVIANMASFYVPVTQACEGLVAWIRYGLYVVPAPMLVLFFVLATWRLAGRGLAALTAFTMGLTVSFGLWEPMQETLALMSVAVVLSCTMGIAVGVVGSVNRRLGELVRLVVDAMQTYPMFSYLVPAVVIFGAGTTSALLVTVIWAMPPVTRLTMVGLRGVSVETVEAAHSLGVTRRQLLWKVQLPMALPSIRAGINQTIMFAMTMAIIASMIGGGGLGDPVWVRLRLLQFGPALEAGICLVLLAIILDRASSGAGAPRKARTSLASPRIRALGSRASHARGALVGLGLIVLVVLGRLLGLGSIDFTRPPAWMQVSIDDRVDSAIAWLNINLGAQFDTLTRAIQNYAIDPAVASLEWLPWPAVLLSVFALALVTIGLRGAAMAVCAVLLVGALDMWSPAVYTAAFVAVAVLATVVLGVPLGVWAARSRAVSAVVRPTLDVMQTLPIFLFVIPSVILLGPGPVAGLLATIAFAIAPVIRLTSLAIRSTDPEIVEAATIFGTTPWQMLRKVRLILGLPTILVGLNQAVLLALAMAVVSAFVGTPGLGRLILLSVTDADLALGVQAGLAMFLVAVVADRIMHGLVSSIARVPHAGRTG